MKIIKLAIFGLLISLTSLSYSIPNKNLKIEADVNKNKAQVLTCTSESALNVIKLKILKKYRNIDGLELKGIKSKKIKKDGYNIIVCSAVFKIYYPKGGSINVQEGYIIRTFKNKEELKKFLEEQAKPKPKKFKI